MFLTTFIMLALVLIFVSTNTRNRYSNIIQFYLVSLVIMSILATVYTVRMTYYSFPLKIDYAIYLAVSNLKIKLVTLRRLYNLSFCLFFFSAVYGYIIILNKRWYRVVYLVIPILIFLFLNDPKFVLNLELKQYTYLSFYNYNTLVMILNTISMLILIFYTLLPYFYIDKYYKKTRYMINKQYTLI